MEVFERFIHTSAGMYVAIWVLICIALECVYAYRRGKALRGRERVSSVAIALVGPFLAGKIFYLLCMNAAFIYVYSHFALFDIPYDRWWGWVLFFFAADLCTYIIHRLEHRVRLFWCSHEVHHSAKQMTVETSVRTSPGAAIYGTTIRLVLPLLGFHPVMHHTETLYAIVFSALNHNEHVGRLRGVDWLLNTPANHRAHHSSETPYLDKNYGSILMIWDHLFGTYKAEQGTLRYGLTKDRNTDNPLVLIALPYMELWKDVRQSPDVATALRYVFYPPGWHPDPAQDSTARTLQRDWVEEKGKIDH